VTQQPYYPEPAGLGGGPPLPPPPPRTNTMAILALVFAFLVAPLGIAFGIVARRQINRTGEGGRGLATAGLVLGSIFTLVGVLLVVAIVVLVALAPRTVRTDAVKSQIIATTQQATGVTPASVTCPDSIPAKAGTVVQCTAQVEDQTLTYDVTVQDDQGRAHIDSRGFISVKSVVKTLEDQVGQQAGTPVTATCDTGGKAVVVGGAGTKFTCTVAAKDDPTRRQDVTVTVTDDRGNATFAAAN
jgi:Tfp pilus assembly major pilin PilA